MRRTWVALVLATACSRPVARAPANVAPAEDAEDEPAATERVVPRPSPVERARDLYEEARRRAVFDEFRALLRAGKLVCTPTGNRVHGPSMICTRKP